MIGIKSPLKSGTRVFVLAGLLILVGSEAFALTITRLTDNDYDDYQPNIDQSGVAWYACPGNDCNPFFGNYEVYYWDFITTEQITFHESPDRFPVINNGRIAWVGVREGGQQIMLWDEGHEFILSELSIRNQSVRVSDSMVVWEGVDTDDTEIWMWWGGVLSQITRNTLQDESPALYDTTVVWVQYQGDDDSTKEIFVWDGSGIIQLTNNSLPDAHPQIWEETIVWEGFDGADWEIYLWQNGTTTRITDNQVNDTLPRICDGKIVWQQGDGQAREIMLWVNGTTTQLTSNLYTDTEPEISSTGHIAWSACPANDCPFSGAGNWEVYAWKDGTTVRVTDNSGYDGAAKLYSNRLVWIGYQNENMEIFMAQLDSMNTPTPVPSTPTPAPIYLELNLNQNYYRTGDLFLLNASAYNTAASYNVDLYIVLEAFGNYWFWPSWIQFPSIDFRTQLQTVGFWEENILNFIWPEGAGAADNLQFWGVMMFTGSYMLASNLEIEPFSYGW